jgi:hypothetical protein
VRRTLLLSVCMVSLVTPLRSEARTCHEFEAGRVTFRENLGGNEVIAVVTSVTLSKQDSHPHAYFGFDEATPSTVISDIELKVAGREIYLPLSTYGDLADPRSACIDTIGAGYRLTISGGSASTAYESALEFDRAVVRRRHTALTEFADERWETIVYSFVQDRGQ